MANKCFTLNVEKLKRGSVTGIHNHNFRKTKDESFVNYSKSHLNKLVLGSEKTQHVLHTHISKTDSKKQIRKDANVLCSFVISASPSYFYDALKTDEDLKVWDDLDWSRPKDRPKLLEIQSSLNQKNLDEFEKQIKKFASETFGDNIVNMVLHLDEKTPHFHLLVTPITSQNKLSMKQFYTPRTLDTWRKGIASHVAKLGLVEHLNEPEPASGLREVGVHTSTRAYRDIELPQPPKTPVPKALTESKVFQTGFLGRKKQVVKTEDVISNWKNREVSLSKQLYFYKDQFAKNANSFKQNELAKLQNAKLKAENAKLKSKNKQLEKEKLMESNNTLEDLRSIDCNDVLESLGHYGKNEGDTTRYKDENINLVVNNQNKFFENRSSVSGGGAIDLLVKIFDFKFKDALAYLKNNFGSDNTARVLLSTKSVSKADVVKDYVEKTVLAMPPSKPKNIDRVINYLVETRKLDKSLVENLINQNLIYADKNNNCIFTNENSTFAFVRGTVPDKRFVGTRGNLDFIKYQFGKTNDLYVFESAIDALSFRTMNPSKDGLYIVTNGSALIKRVHELGDKFNNVYCCFDNDEQGKKFCATIKEQVVSKVSVVEPHAKDFNEDLILWQQHQPQTKLKL